MRPTLPHDMDLFSTRLGALVAAPYYAVASGAALTCATVVLVLNTNGWNWQVMTTALLTVAPLTLRRACPAIAGLAVVGAAVLHLWVSHGVPILTAEDGGLVGCYTLARRRVLHPALLIPLAAAGVTWGMRRDDGGPVLWGPSIGGLYVPVFEGTLLIVAVVVATVSLGEAVRSSEKRKTAQRELMRAARQQEIEAERAAIVREVHDVVAHSVSMIAVQAESATYTAPGQTPEAREAFQQVALSARSSLTELRSVLATLRPYDAPETAKSPQPTLEQLHELMEQHQSVGGSAELLTNGEKPPLPASVELSLYRIVQEALTNARRHAPGAHTVIAIEYLTDAVHLRIEDDGPGPSADCADRGHGLAGMRERAAILGGEVRSGPGHRGGFLIEANLPFSAGPPREDSGPAKESTPE